MRSVIAALSVVLASVTGLATVQLVETPAVAEDPASAQVLSDIDIPGGIRPTSAISLADGGMAVSGTSQDEAMVIVRLAADGSLDRRFAGTGWVRVPLDGPSTGTRVRTDETGALYLAGWWSPGPAPTGSPTDLVTHWLLRGAGLVIAKFGSDGRLDHSFGTGGIATSGPEELAPVDGGPIDMVIAPGGRPVVLGIAGVGLGYYGYPSATVLMGFTPDGRRDMSFGVAGVAVAGHPSALPGAKELALQPDGKLVVGSTLHDTFFSLWFPPGPDLVVSRFLPNGVPDAQFGTGGVSRHDLMGSTDQLESLAIDSAGRIVCLADTGEGLLDAVPNGTNEDWGWSPALVRLLPDGAADPAFGERGIAVLKRDATKRRLLWSSDLALMPGDRPALSSYLTDIHGRMVVVPVTAAGAPDTAVPGRGSPELPLDYTVALLTQPGRLLAVGGRNDASGIKVVSIRV